MKKYEWSKKARHKNFYNQLCDAHNWVEDLLDKWVTQLQGDYDSTTYQSIYKCLSDARHLLYLATEEYAAKELANGQSLQEREHYVL